MSKILTRWAPRATVAAVIERDGKYLLIEEDTRDGLRWNNPSGHLELGESLIEACIRETREEAGWEFKPDALVGVYLHRFMTTQGADLTYLRFCFSGQLGEHFVNQPLDEGIVRAVWMTYDEVESCANCHRTPLVMQGLDDYRKGCRYPLSILTTNASTFGLFEQPELLKVI